MSVAVSVYEVCECVCVCEGAVGVGTCLQSCNHNKRQLSKCATVSSWTLCPVNRIGSPQDVCVLTSVRVYLCEHVCVCV